MTLIDRSMRTRVAAATMVVSGVVLMVTGTAHAHIEAQPTTIEAGARATIGFLVEHGCDGGLETTALEITVPSGVGDPVPGAVAGWTATTTGAVVVFSGGPLGHDTPATFPIEITAPATAGQQLTFPTLQRCGEVVERWIELAVPGQNPEDLELPAPVVAITPSTSSTTVPTTAAPADDPAERPDPSASPTESETDDGTSPWILVGAAVLIAAMAAGAVLFVRSRRRHPGPDS